MTGRVASGPLSSREKPCSATSLAERGFLLEGEELCVSSASTSGCERPASAGRNSCPGSGLFLPSSKQKPPDNEHRGAPKPAKHGNGRASTLGGMLGPLPVDAASGPALHRPKQALRTARRLEPLPLCRETRDVLTMVLSEISGRLSYIFWRLEGVWGHPPCPAHA